MPLQFAEPFVERYRPKTLEEVVGNTVAIEQLKSIVRFGNMPNLILVVSISHQPHVALPLNSFFTYLGSTRHRKNVECFVHGKLDAWRDGQGGRLRNERIGRARHRSGQREDQRLRSLESKRPTRHAQDHHLG